MVDTIIDNITLRTQRKVELRLEIGLRTGSQQIQLLLEAIRLFLNSNKAVEQSTVFLSDTGKNAHVIIAEYFTGMQQSIEEFNRLKEKLNLAVIEKMEQAGIELAASNLDVVMNQR